MLDGLLVLQRRIDPGGSLSSSRRSILLLRVVVGLGHRAATAPGTLTVSARGARAAVEATLARRVRLGLVEAGALAWFVTHVGDVVVVMLRDLAECTTVAAAVRSCGL